MRKRLMGIMCVIVILCIVTLLSARWIYHLQYVYAPMGRVRDRILGIPIVEDLDFLEQKEQISAEKNPGVLFEDVLLPYDVRSNTLYLSQSADTDEWVGKLCAGENEFFLCATQDAYWNKKQEAIREGYAFEVWLVGEESYYKLNLVISGAPIISLYTNDKEKLMNGEEVQGEVSVFNPSVGTDCYEINQSYVMYRIKGSSSRAHEKKGYALKLLDYKGKKLDVSLLGMRADNSWKLNALYTDDLKIREKTALQIWEQFCEANPEIKQKGARMEYVELILNDEYVGIYGLVEPIDEDKLHMDENDVLYKCVSWAIPTNEAFANAIEQRACTAESIRINYPKVISEYSKVWSPMQDYNERFFVNPELDYEQALATVDVENLSDVFIFLMVTSASDNSHKNLYYAAEVSDDGSYVMRQIPWDLDYTFGRTYPMEFDENYGGVYANSTLPRLKFANKEEIGTFVLNRWKDYRATFLKTKNILDMLVENRDYLMKTGAIKRECERWKDLEISSDIDYLLEWQENRMNWLDEFFADWATN